MRKISYSIVAPCFNESKNIPLILKKFKKAIGQRNDIELILVDNGSVDDSWSVFKKHIPNFIFAKTTRIKKNIGYGHGILYGLQIAQGKFLGWTHADLQTDPADIIEAIKIIEKTSQAERLFIKGKRTKRPVIDKILSLGMGFFASFHLGSYLYEINAQPTIFSRTFFDAWNNPPHDFSLDLYAYYQAKKLRYKIIRIPVLFPNRKFGKSSWNDSWKSRAVMISRSIKYIINLKKE